jgi:NAD+ synthetase
MSELNYEHVFNVLVDKTAEYVTSNNLKAMVLGISGGIDSTVVAAICHEVSKKTDIPLIGRSLPIKNKEDEFSVSELVGEAFCDEFKVFNLSNSYKASLFDLCADAGLIKDCKGYDWYWVSDLEELTGRTPIANGNLQARCRMKHLYDIASIRKGLVMSTDNQTEYQLGFWTIHGDVGDFDPIQDLWKTEVYELAEWLRMKYVKANQGHADCYHDMGASQKEYAITQSIALTPTDGLGISNSDLEQIGAKSYDEVDDILSRYIPFKEYRQKHGEPLHPHDEMAESDCWSQLCVRHGEDVVNKVWSRHLASEFKRKKAPIYISRELYE